MERLAHEMSTAISSPATRESNENSDRESKTGTEQDNATAPEPPRIEESQSIAGFDEMEYEVDDVDYIRRMNGGLIEFSERFYPEQTRISSSLGSTSMLVPSI